MMTSEIQQKILHRLSEGLAICDEPYQQLAQEVGVTEAELLDFIQQSQSNNTIKRLGIVVNHHQLGYLANAMVVWNVPDEKVDEVGELLAAQECITLCYQRPRRLPIWPYNLFTMIHGKDRDLVISKLDKIVCSLSLQVVEKEILFSSKKFKQTGARYDSQSN